LISMQIQKMIRAPMKQQDRLPSTFCVQFATHTVVVSFLKVETWYHINSIEPP
jgi:hypothetical protein